jgi:hypothetical protein
LGHNSRIADQIVQAPIDGHQHAFGCAIVPVADELEHCRLEVGANCQELILNILRDCERHRLLPLQYNSGIGDSDTLLSELRELQLPHIWRIRWSRSCQETLVRPDFIGIASRLGWTNKTRSVDLSAREPVEGASPCHQFVVGAAFHDAAGFQYDNAITVAEGTETIGDDQARPADFRDALPYDRLSAIVEGGHRMVEEE